MSKEKQSENDQPLDPEIIEESLEETSETDVDSGLGELTMEDLLQLLEETEAQSAMNLDGWQRSKAEFINYRKRMERDQARVYQDAAARVIKNFLPVLDDLHRALQNAPTEGEAAEWAAGVELVYRKLQNVLEGEGVMLMDVDGQMFDPNLHEAISQSESPDHESGQIIEVIQQGYMIGDRVLRAALVRVAS